MGRIRKRKVLPGGRTPYSGEEAYQHLQREYEGRLNTEELTEAVKAFGTTAWTDKHLGSGSALTTYYAAGVGGGTAGTRTTLAPATGFLSAYPLFCPNYETRIDSLSIYISAGAAAGREARVGVYRNKGQGDLYPTTLAVEAEFSLATTGTKEATISVLCDPGELLWVAFTTNNSTPTWGAFDRNTVGQGLLGFEDRTVVAATNPTAGHYVAFTYASLPKNFPLTGRTAATANFPALYVHFSAP